MKGYGVRYEGLKSAKVNTVVVCKDYYNEYDIENMLIKREIFYFTDNYHASYEIPLQIYSKDYRIFTKNIDEMIVEYDKTFEMYVTVSYLNNGARIVLNIL